jgi:pimeloyl-ACP methyl ester carboxylesterase
MSNLPRGLQSTLRAKCFASAVIIMAGGASFDAAAAQSGSDSRGTVKLNSCQVDGVPGPIRCGTYEVFEDRDAGRGRRISLKIIVLAAAESKHEPDPLFILAGGPGQAATENTKFFAKTFDQVRRTRDIVLVDQRGTGGSNGLKCDLYGSSIQGHLGDLFPIEAVRHCADQWKVHADLRFYTTEIAVADLDEVRRAMDYERINLFGTSYGTRAAQVYMRLFPTRIRSVILKGVTPINLSFLLPMAQDAQRALNLLCEDCAADPACQTAFPQLKDEVDAVFKRLQQDTEVEVRSTTGKIEKVKISRSAIAPTIRTLLQSTVTSAELPLFIHQAFQGNYGPLVESALSIRRVFPKAVSIGVFLAISTIEDVAIADEKEIARFSNATFLGDSYFKELQRAAMTLPHKEMPPGYRTPVRSDIPTLLISGFLDPATPPTDVEQVARYLPNSRHLIVRYGSHSYSELSPCMDKIMTEFIEQGSTEGLDASCIDQVRRPPFVTSEKSAAARQDN